jgi:hypothetical protein
MLCLGACRQQEKNGKKGVKPEEQPLLEGEHQRSDAADPDSASGHAKSTERALVEVLSALSHVCAPLLCRCAP